MSLLGALSKIGLVELDEDEKKAIAKKRSKKDSKMSMADIDRMLEEEGIDPNEGAPPKAAPQKVAARPAPAPKAKAAPATSGARPNISSQEFASIYKNANLEESVYSAEKMLKLIDGLRSMDGQTRKTAILAMDAADDEWTIADPVMDAKRKIRVLTQHKNGLDATLNQVAQTTTAEINKLAEYQTKAEQTIHEQIAKLEAQLKAEIESVTQRKAKLGQELTQNQQECSKEKARIDQEITRLNEVPQTFESSLTPRVPSA